MLLMVTEPNTPKHATFHNLKLGELAPFLYILQVEDAFPATLIIA